ncbi:hypothetical protein L9F63_023309, partial [Diploptera punctata]
NPNDIVVIWSTLKTTVESIVNYRVVKESFQYTSGNSFLFVNVNKNEKRDQYIHSVVLHNLKPGAKYEYICGSRFSWSKMFWFVVPTNNTVRLAIFGDMGYKNATSLPYLTTDVSKKMYDAIFHLGDIAYDLYMGNGRVADKFMELIQPIAAHVPYMVCPGNHEEYKNYRHYKKLFKMPGTSEGLWYSFNLGPAHFISISTEVYYLAQFKINLINDQYNWLLKDLEGITATHCDRTHPWIIMYGHRPMYCSNYDNVDCTNHLTLTRVGVTSSHRFGLEELLNIFGVDLVMWAHVHSYERSWPVYDYEVYNGSYEEPYHNPRAPVHINVGSGGTRFSKTTFRAYIPEWSAYRTAYQGYMRMQIFNETHLYLEQISVDEEGLLLDNFYYYEIVYYPFKENRT